MEVENDNPTLFFDVLIKRKNDGRLCHSVYRKPSHTNRYLNGESHHYPARINEVAKTLLKRSIRIPDDDFNQLYFKMAI